MEVRGKVLETATMRDNMLDVLHRVDVKATGERVERGREDAEASENIRSGVEEGASGSEDDDVSLEGSIAKAGKRE